MTEKLKISCFEEGLILEFRGKRIALDRVSTRNVDYHFISHAHGDHLPRKPCGKVLASAETIELASERGILLKEKTAEAEKMKLINSGHILGSRSLLIGDKVLYTGDVNVRKRFFIEGFKPPKIDVLIMEATYGREEYVFGQLPMDKSMGLKLGVV